MSAVDEKVNEVLRMMYNIVDIGRLFGKAEAYQHMFEVLRKSNLRTSNPKLVLNTICMSLDSSSDVLERGKNFIEESSHTMATQVDTLLQTIAKLSDDIRLASNEGKYEEAFSHLTKASKDVTRFMKENEETFKVYMEVTRKRIIDIFRKQGKRD